MTMQHTPAAGEDASALSGLQLSEVANITLEHTVEGRLSLDLGKMLDQGSLSFGISHLVGFLSDAYRRMSEMNKVVDASFNLAMELHPDNFVDFLISDREHQNIEVEKERVEQLMFASEAVVRMADCRNLFDVLPKIRMAATWLDRASNETAAVYADEHFQILRSMVPLLRAHAPADPCPDTLGHAIRVYRDSVLTFNSLGGERVGEAAYDLPLAVLENWTEPARSFDEAIAALRLAKEELEAFYPGGVIHPMVAAALGFLEGAARRE